MRPLFTRTFGLTLTMAWSLTTGCAMELTEGEPFEGEPAAVAAALCTGFPNADAFPLSPVPVQSTPCTNVQEFTAVSNANVNYGSCGFTASFGQSGDKVYPARHQLHVEWTTSPTNPTACAQARTDARAFGFLCAGEHCSEGAWQEIGVQTRAGSWNSISNVCYTSVSLVTPKEPYLTVGVSFDTYSRTRLGDTPASGRATIRAWNPNGQCFRGGAN
ncbi:MAG: hypothetical protein AAGF12_20785 [Myxococcota bacterium]